MSTLRASTMGASNAGVVGLDPRALCLATKRPGDPLAGPLEDRHDFAFGPACAASLKSNAHRITVHGAAQRLGRNEDVVAHFAQRGHEAKAPRVDRQQPVLAFGAPRGDRLGRELEPLPWARGQDTLEAHVVEHSLQAEVIALRNPEPRRDFAGMQRSRVGTQQVEAGMSAWEGSLVAMTGRIRSMAGSRQV